MNAFSAGVDMVIRHLDASHAKRAKLRQYEAELLSRTQDMQQAQARIAELHSLIAKLRRELR